MMVNRLLLNPWIPERVHPITGETGPTLQQMKFLLSDRRELFFGGAAGGGKSDALGMGYLRDVGQFNDYHGIIFRRTRASLIKSGGLIKRLQEWAVLADWKGKGASWNGSEYTWTFPRNNTLEFGYMQSDYDYEKYLSTEYQYIGWDELPEQREFDFRIMFSRLRRTMQQKMDGMVLRMRATGNPIGRGVAWVKRRYNLPHGLKDKPYIPAKIEDNPYLDREDYIESLGEMDPVSIERMMNGDWSIQDIGAMFNKQDLIMVQKLPLIKGGSELATAALNKRNPWQAVRYWDLASTAERQGVEPAYTAGCLMATRDMREFYICHMVRTRKAPGDVVQLMKDTAIADAKRVNMRVRIFCEQEPGGSGVYVIKDLARHMAGYTFEGDKVTGPKPNRAIPFSTATKQGMIYYLPGPWNNDMLDELEAFPAGQFKDLTDTLSGAYNMLTQKKQRSRYKSRRG